MIKKLTFEEIIKTSTVFYVNDNVEKEFDKFIRQKAEQIIQTARKPPRQITVEDVLDFLINEQNGLKRILKILHLSQEKFLRIVTLLRKIQNTYDGEWSFDRVKREVQRNKEFARKLAEIFIDGKNDPELIKYLPLYYRERLNLRTLKEFETEDELILSLKDQYMADYHKLKGYAVEELIRKQIEKIGLSYGKGKTEIVDVTVDWAIPDVKNPQIVIMSSYQETTSSSQSVKAREMIRCYEAIHHINIQRGENRLFINFVDGGGWLARQADLKRLVNGCHYFLNINTLCTLEDIAKQHFPNLPRQSKL